MARRFIVSVFVSDLIALGVALFASAWLVFGVGEATIPEGSSLLPFAALMAVGAAIGSWVNGRAWANSVPRPTYGRAFAIVASASMFTAVSLVLSRVYWSRPMFALTVVIWFTLAAAHRAVRRRRPWTEAMVIVTDEKQLAEELRVSDHADVVAVYSSTEEAPDRLIADDVSLVLDLRSVLSESMAQFVSSASIAGAIIRPLANVYEQHTGRFLMVHLAEGWEISEPVARSRYAPVKRVIDVFLVAIAAPLWVPIAIIVWLLVRIDSKGPALYRQERVGRGNQPFTLYKFRSMVDDAEANGPRFASVDDPRVTSVGRLIRKTRLDEIPQMWNVVVGDLSLVGPRPERPVFVQQFEREIPFYRSRHLIRPGLTGWAQVNQGYGDSVADAVDKLTYDLYYVKNSSIWLDLQIIGATVWTVLSGSGAR